MAAPCKDDSHRLNRAGIGSTERLAEAGIEPSVGSTGDSYDNALAESAIGLHKTEVNRRRGPWKGVEGVELATLEWSRGTTRAACWSRSGTFPPTSLRGPITVTSRRRSNWWHSRYRVSGKPGAVHRQLRDPRRQEDRPRIPQP